MKILLLNPNDYMFTELNGSSNPYNVRVFPYGLAAIASHIKEQADFPVELAAVDGMLAPHHSTAWLEDAIADTEPDVVIGVVTVHTIHLWADRLRALKQARPFRFIALIHLPFAEGCVELLPWVDAIVYREWLETCVQVLSAWAHQGDLRTVKGIHLPHNGRAVFTGPGRHLPLAAYPLPDYTLFPLHAYEVFPGFWTDGCAYRCTYCYFGVYPESGWESKRIESILDEIGGLADAGVQRPSIAVIDHEFSLNPSFAMDLFDALSRLDIELSINANTRVNRVSRQLVRAAEHAGVTTFGIGIESGVQRVLDRNNKGFSLRQVRDAVRLIHASTIFLQGYIQVGLLGETRSDFLRTVDFVVDRLKLQRVELGVGIPYPGTPMEKELLERGWLPKPLTIGNLLWVYKNVYGYPFLQGTEPGEEPCWRVSNDLDFPEIVDLYRQHIDKMPKTPSHHPLSIKGIVRTVRRRTRFFR